MLKIKDIMTKKVITIKKTDKVIDAAKAMASKPVSCLLVTDKNKPIGILTERDMVREMVVNERNPEKTKVQDIMTPNIKPIDQNMDLFDTIKLMKTKHVRRFPVMSKSKLIGLVTETDIVNATISIESDLVEKLGKGNLSIKDYKKEYTDLSKKLKEVKSLYSKINTGSDDLNNLIGGGFPIGANVMVEGVPGSGKTVIAFAYLYQGIKEGDMCIYLYSNETIEDIKNSFKSMGFVPNFDNFYFIHLGEKETKKGKNIFNVNIEDLNKILETLDKIVSKSKGKVRCVINVLSQVMMLWKPQTIYHFVFKLTENLKTSKVTSLFLIEEGMHELKNVISMEQLMDGVIKITTEEKGMKTEKKLMIKKMGSGASAPNKYFPIEFKNKKGLVIKD